MIAALALAVVAGGPAAAAEAKCTPGAAPEHDPLTEVPNPPKTTAGPFVLGCWKLVGGGRAEVHGRRMMVGRGEPREHLCLGTSNKVECFSRWRPTKPRSIAGTSCGGGNGFVFVQGTITTRVKRVDVRYRDAQRRKRSRRASVVWMRGEVAEKLRSKPFGYYLGETEKGAEVIEVLARDGDGRVLDRIEQTGCNRPR